MFECNETLILYQQHYFVKVWLTSILSKKGEYQLIDIFQKVKSLYSSGKKHLISLTFRYTFNCTYLQHL